MSLSLADSYIFVAFSPAIKYLYINVHLMSTFISFIFTFWPSVIPTDSRETLSEAEGEARLSGGDPDDLSRAMPHQGVLPIHFHLCPAPLRPKQRSVRGSALVQTRRAEALPDFRLASPLHEKEETPGEARGVIRARLL